RTGEVQGERPYSAWKIAVAVILGLIVAGVVGYFVLKEQGAMR
ncbi:MAG: primosomal protein N' (replication factor Y) - superfamily II helicase, partial [Alphaproteobacteria bacterium]